MWCSGDDEAYTEPGPSCSSEAFDRDTSSEAVLLVRDRLREPARPRRVEDGGHVIGGRVQVERS